MSFRDFAKKNIPRYQPPSIPKKIDTRHLVHRERYSKIFKLNSGSIDFTYYLKPAGIGQVFYCPTDVNEVSPEFRWYGPISSGVFDEGVPG